MKLKHILLTAVMGAFAASASAATADDLKIYINPGHGSWGPNNRHCATIGHSPISTEDPDTTDFFESNTNLVKCLALFHRLCDYGLKNDGRNGLDLTQNVAMSRIENGPYPYSNVKDETLGYIPDDSNNAYNRKLSEIAAEAETFGADMFISVHSNAYTDGTNTNYLYFCLDGYADASGDKIAISKEMSRCGWNHRILDRHTMWTSYDYTMTAADVAAGKGKIEQQDLGVLNHDIPGYLVEGYFHTYQPARHKAMNFDVDWIEGITYARGVADYYGLTKESTGDIYGVVRDHHEKFADELYTPNTSTYDKYLPLNGVEVTLWKDGAEVAKLTTDVNYNGAFVFKNLAPGDYTVTFSKEDYEEGKVWTSDSSKEEASASLAVTVKAAEVAYPTAFLENVNYVPPTIVYVNYPDSTAGKGYTMLPKYETKATAYDLLATQLEGKTVRRQLLRDDKLYVLALDSSNEPSVYIADLAGDSIITLGTSAATGDIYKVSDIALTADGYLVGINKANQAYGGSKNIIGYKWEKDATTGLPTGELAVWWSNNFAGNYNNGIAGEALTYDGTLADGKMIYSARTTATNGNTRLVICSINEGVYTGYYRNNQDGTYLSTAYLGDTFEMTLSPRSDDQIIFNSTAVQPFEIQLNSADAGVPTILAHMSDDAIAKASAGESYFKYADKDFMVAPKINDEGKVAGVQLFDITDGLANAVEIPIKYTFDPVDYTYASAHGELALTLSADDKTTGATIELFLAVDGKVTKFTVGDFYTSVAPATGGTANPFAYALKSEVAINTLNVSYSLNAAATDVNILIKNEEGETVATHAAGALAAGDYTAEIALDELENGNYTWEIEVAGETATTVTEFASWNFYHPSGMDVDNSFESGSFGTLFVCEGYNQGKTSGYVSAQADGSYGGGLYIFNPKGEQVLNKDGGTRFYPSFLTCTDRIFNGVDDNGAAATHTNGADFARVAIAEDGRIFVNRYNTAGDYYLYAESLEQLVADGEFTSLVAGKTMTDAIYYDESGNYLAGPAQAFDVIGSGEDLKLVAISRKTNSISTGTSLNLAVEYALGTSAVLPTPTYVDAFNAKYTISRDRAANIQFDNEGGIWYVQYRGTPNNTEPALVYVDANGELKYFEGTGGKVRRGAGLSVSPDGTRLAVPSAAGTVSVYEIIRLEDGSIYLNEEYKITGVGNNEYALAWDAAGNLYGGNASKEFVKGYAIPRTEPFTTKAASKYAFTITSSGVENVDAADAVDAAPVYYNLQGVQVENPENGIYIVKRGNKVTKEYIRK
ncbi:MAG: hypothetical protein IJY31_05340 [Muribaculaceae bacterium]|nr:hypothetical protein [Muribaculaceae bacterium]